MKQMSIALVAGARPNFMKVAPLFHALSGRKESARKAGIDPCVSIVHTGQHYDPNMSDIFFRELGMPAPDRHLDVGSGSHAEQTAIIMVAFGKVLTDAISDLLFVTEESTRGPARGSRTSCWGGDLGGSNAAAVGLTGFLCTGRMDSVGNEIWPEGGREGYR